MGPVRTCVGCRKTGPRSALLRVVADAAGVLVVDERRRMPGRGAWLHPDPGCLDLAERRRAFVRALRLAGPADVAAVRRHVEQQEAATGPIPGAEQTVDEESGLEADGYPMSTNR
ncbi:YlxR family protein [Cellulomonas sp. MW4]|uniref:YlxR family protein n=1 Tax=Cellulomonas alba TaxID=3053467 RepID=A0ABT7SIV1_9CELL|nr:YlxR family protein [Cellulomonas alba]MDM7856107.1 YlxR family protein [Cellulomonas alba]